MSLPKAGLDNLKHRVHDAGAAIQDAQRRVTQQALEAAGMADKTAVEDEDMAELVHHQKLESFLRRSYSHADKFMRAMNSMCEMSRSLADEYPSVLIASWNSEFLGSTMALLGRLGTIASNLIALGGALIAPCACLVFINSF